MTSFDFFNLLTTNIKLYFLSLGLVVVIYSFIMRSIVKSILDPVFMALIGAVFANTIPLFLYFCGLISNEYIIYIICIETTFWGTYFLFHKRYLSCSRYVMNDGKASLATFKIMLVICIGSYLLTYAVLGIPLFKQTHTEVFLGGGGWGLLSHISDFSLFFVVVYSFYLLRTKNTLAKASIGLAIVFCLLSGSKSSILVLAHGYFFYLYYYCNKTFSLKKNKRYIALICMFPVITLMAHFGTNPYSAYIGVIERFVGYGDMYFMALPNNAMDEVTINHPYTYILQGILGPLRLIDYSTLDINIGTQLANIVYPDLNVPVAPNSRLPLLGWICFGWGGIILSFVLGAFFAFVRTRLYSMFPQGIIPLIVYGFIYTGMTSILTDPILAISKLFTLMFFGIVIWIVLFMLYGKKIKLKKVQHVNG